MGAHEKSTFYLCFFEGQRLWLNCASTHLNFRLLKKKISFSSFFDESSGEFFSLICLLWITFVWKCSSEGLRPFQNLFHPFNVISSFKIFFQSFPCSPSFQSKRGTSEVYLIASFCHVHDSVRFLSLETCSVVLLVFEWKLPGCLTFFHTII